MSRKLHVIKLSYAKNMICNRTSFIKNLNMEDLLSQMNYFSSFTLTINKKSDWIDSPTCETYVNYHLNFVTLIIFLT